MKLILLTYVNRSGSTFLANTLSKSKDIMVFPEAEILVNLLLVQPELKFDLFDEIGTQIKIDPKLKCWNLSIDSLSVLQNVETNFEAFVEILKAYKNRYKPDAKILLFKAERLIYLYDRIHIYFKQKFNLFMVGLVRDPRGIFASQKRTKMPLNGTDMSQNPVYTTICWDNFVTVLDSIESRDDVLNIKFENLILQYSETCGNLMTRLGISNFNFSFKGDLWDRIPFDQRSIHLLIDKKPDKERIDKWKDELKENEIYLIERYSSKGMRAFGYQPEVVLRKRVFKQDLVGCFYWALYYLRRVINKVLFRVYKKKI